MTTALLILIAFLLTLCVAHLATIARNQKAQTVRIERALEAARKAGGAS